MRKCLDMLMSFILKYIGFLAIYSQGVVGS